MEPIGQSGEADGARGLRLPSRLKVALRIAVLHAAHPRRERLPQNFKALFDLLTGCVDPDVLSHPRFVFALQDLLPSYRNVVGAHFDAATVLSLV